MVQRAEQLVERNMSGHNTSHDRSRALRPGPRALPRRRAGPLLPDRRLIVTARADGCRGGAEGTGYGGGLEAPLEEPRGRAALMDSEALGLASSA